MHIDCLAAELLFEKSKQRVKQKICGRFLTAINATKIEFIISHRQRRQFTFHLKTIDWKNGCIYFAEFVDRALLTTRRDIQWH